MLIPSLCSCNCDIHEGVTFPYHHKNIHMSGGNNGVTVFVGFLSHRVLILPLTQEEGSGISWCHIHNWWHKYVKYSGSLSIPSASGARPLVLISKMEERFIPIMRE